jgi:hypothetical protein
MSSTGLEWGSEVIEFSGWFWFGNLHLRELDEPRYVRQSVLAELHHALGHNRGTSPAR